MPRGVGVPPGLAEGGFGDVGEVAVCSQTTAKTMKTVKKAMKERKSKVKYVMNPELDKKPMKTMKGSPKVSPKMKKIKGSGKVSTKVSPKESLKELKEFLADEKMDGVHQRNTAHSLKLQENY